MVDDLLPPEAVVSVLSFLPLEDRVLSCRHVNRKWRTASEAITCLEALLLKEACLEKRRYRTRKRKALPSQEERDQLDNHLCQELKKSFWEFGYNDSDHFPCKGYETIRNLLDEGASPVVFEETMEYSEEESFHDYLPFPNHCPKSEQYEFLEAIDQGENFCFRVWQDLICCCAPDSDSDNGTSSWMHSSNYTALFRGYSLIQFLFSFVCGTKFMIHGGGLCCSFLGNPKATMIRRRRGRQLEALRLLRLIFDVIAEASISSSPAGSRRQPFPNAGGLLFQPNLTPSGTCYPNFWIEFTHNNQEIACDCVELLAKQFGTRATLEMVFECYLSDDALESAMALCHNRKKYQRLWGRDLKTNAYYACLCPRVTKLLTQLQSPASTEGGQQPPPPLVSKVVLDSALRYVWGNSRCSLETFGDDPGTLWQKITPVKGSGATPTVWCTFRLALLNDRNLRRLVLATGLRALCKRKDRSMLELILVVDPLLVVESAPQALSLLSRVRGKKDRLVDLLTQIQSVANHKRNIGRSIITNSNSFHNEVVSGRL